VPGQIAAQILTRFPAFELHKGESGMTMSSARELFIHELSDTLSAENIIYKMLGKVAKETQLPEARKGYEKHLKETEQHIANVEAAFKSLGEAPEKTTCLAAKGLSEEHDALKEEEPTGHALELGLLGGAGKTEHYEIASYTLLVQMAKDLGETEAVKLLQANLDDELTMAKEVEKLATSVSRDAKKAEAVPA
jgi:ferritin-like metal-binding protein YciE